MMTAIHNLCVEYSWTPHYCAELYLDDIDVFGLLYWNDIVVEHNKKINNK